MPGVDFTSYQQPGVYISEIQGPQASARLGEGIILGLVGRSQGYRTITEQTALNGVTAYDFQNVGVLASGISVVGRSNGVAYVANTDHTVTIDGGTGAAEVVRKLTAIAHTETVVTDEAYVADHDVAVALDNPAGTFIRDGSVVVTSSPAGTTFVEDTDYTVNYFNGTITVLASGSIADAANLLVDYHHCQAEPFSFSGEAAQSFGHPTYVEDGTVVVKSADGNTTYVEDTDYVVDYDAGTIARVLGGSLPEDTVVYVAYSHCRIKSGSQVAVTYKYADATYNNVIRFTDFDEVVEAYGAPFNSDGTINSPISLMAFFAFRNRAEVVYCVATASNTPTQTDYEDAIDKFETVETVDIMTVDTGDSAVHAYLKSHIAAMVENQSERRAILGTDGSATPLTAAQLIARATALGSERIMLLSPSTIQYFNPVSNSVQVLPAYYLAAAVAGLSASLAPFEPLTMKTVEGFYNVNETRSKANRLNEMRNGLAYVDTYQGPLKVMHGKSTDTTTVEKAEWSVSFAKDKMMQALRAAFANNIVGQPITPETPYLVKSMTIGVLERLKTNRYIASHKNHKARQNQNDPTLIEVKFEYGPTYPTNYLWFQFSIDTKSGAVEEV